MSAYQDLCDFASEIALVRSSASTLGWDQETYMPERALEHRSRQLAWLSGRAHEMATGDKFARLLETAEDEGVAQGSDAADLREWRWRFDRSRLLPSEFVEDFTRTTSHAKAAWADARATDDYAKFAPWLSKILDLNLRQAEIWGYDQEPFDALIAEYERGATTASISEIFSPLREQIVGIAQEAVELSRQRGVSLPPGPYAVEDQMAFNREIAEALGFDFAGGRIDTTAHPFCTDLGPGDVRLTTRYDEADFTSSLFGVMHEAGHGLYEQGLPESRFGRPSGQAVSLGIHESQSRLWENHVGLSREFWNVWFEPAQRRFAPLRAMELEDFLHAIRRADYSLIRVEADEATYDLHILARFELERRLLRKELDVADLPAAWNQQYRELLGLTPSDDAHGCLQDIHWSMGAFGYFPTYTLGNLNAAQIFAAARCDSKVGAAVEKGDFLPLLAWMKTAVHEKGSVLFPADLMRHATGKPPAADDYLNHLGRRYTCG